MGRVGRLRRPASLASLVSRLKKAAGLKNVQVAMPGRPPRKVSKVACCAGSCGELFRAALSAGAQAYVTGEMRHHDALAASAGGMAAICLGHSSSERPVVPVLAARLRQALRGVKVAVSKADRDPLEVL